MTNEEDEDEANVVEDKKYLSGADAHMRLDSSLVLYDGIYYWANQTETTSGMLFNLSRFDTLGVFTIMKKGVNCNNPNLDAIAKDIGYVNLPFPDGVIYISRAPVKKYKQGIAAVNCLYTQPGNSSQYKKLSNETLLQVAVFNTLDGIFPTFKSILESGVKTRAFSHDFCVHEGRVLFKNTEVGKVKKGEVALSSLHNDSVLTYRLASLGVGVY